MELFRLIGKVVIDGTDEAKGELKDVTNTAEKSQGKLTKSFSKVAAAGKTLAKGATIAGAAIAAVGGAMIAVADNTREYRTEMAKLETAFTTVGHSSDAAKKTFNALQSVLGETEQAVEASNHLAKLVTNEQDLATWTDICTGVYATFGASLPIEALTEAANETARTGQLTGALADALNWAGVSEDEFQAQLDACNTQQERQALITSTLNGLYDDAAQKYKEVNKDVLAANAAQNRMAEGMAALGAIVEPVVTAFKYFAGTVLLEVAEAIEKVIGWVGNLVVKFKEAKEIFGNTKGSLGTYTRGGVTYPTVKWNAEGGVLTKPTIFGMAGNTLLGGGEAGAEAIAPISTLQSYVEASVAKVMNQQTPLLQGILNALVQNTGEMTAVVQIDGKQVAKSVFKPLQDITKQHGRSLITT